MRESFRAILESLGGTINSRRRAAGRRGSRRTAPAGASDDAPTMGAGGGIIHEIGSVRMGDDPRTSVLNKFCQAHNVKNVFAADGGPFVEPRRQEPHAHDHRAGMANGRVPGRRNEEGQCLTSPGATSSAVSQRRSSPARASIDLLAQEAHHLVQQSTAGGGAYTPKALSLPEFRTLERLTDLIVPIENGKPGAVAAGVPEWIDSLLAVNDELKARYTKGLAWIDAAMKSRGAEDFDERHASTGRRCWISSRTRRTGPRSSIRGSTSSSWRDG